MFNLTDFILNKKQFRLSYLYIKIMYCIEAIYLPSSVSSLDYFANQLNLSELKYYLYHHQIIFVVEFTKS